MSSKKCVRKSIDNEKYGATSIDNEKISSELIEKEIQEIEIIDMESSDTEKNPVDMASVKGTDDEGSKNISKGSKMKKKSDILYDFIALVIRIAWIIFFIGVVYVFVIGITVNRGEGMLPSFRNNDVIFYYRLAHKFEAGDVVVYTSGKDTLCIGRVVAIPGDMVDITVDGLAVNGYYRKESYTVGETDLVEGGMTFPITLSEGQYFVLCDNREKGIDSRMSGPMTLKKIKGRVMISIRRGDF